MKRDQIVILPKCIVLGVFNTDTFLYFKCDTNAISYSRFEDELGINWKGSILDRVELACERANQIIFVLDDIQFPINPSRSFTCSELKLICDNADFFAKTTFVKGDNIIQFDKNLVYG